MHRTAKVNYSERPFIRVGRLIRNLRISAGMAQHELAEKVQINNSYLSRIENGERRPSPKIMKRMSQVLPASYEDLVQASGLISEGFTIVPKDDKARKDIVHTLDDLRSLLADFEKRPLQAARGKGGKPVPTRRGAPVYSRIPAGFFDETNVVQEFDAVEQIVLAEEELGYDPKAFALSVKGDSMADAGIFEDDIVIVSPNTKVANGDIAAVGYGNVDITLKRFYQEGGVIVLQPCNARYHPITLSDPSEVHVLGKVILVRRKLY